MVYTQAYTDGACRGGNPGQCSCAFVVMQGLTLIFDHSRYLGPELHTNNYAEYQGLLDLLSWANLHKVRNLEIYSDSSLIVNQVRGRWKVNKEDLKPLCHTATALFIRGGHTLHLIKGHDGNVGNEHADRLCNRILDMTEKAPKVQTLSIMSSPQTEYLKGVSNESSK